MYGKNQIKILVAEDIKIQNIILTKTLQQYGHFVESVYNGQDALQKFKETKYSLVFLDNQMPIFNGSELVPMMRDIDRERSHYSTIIAITADQCIPTFADSTDHCLQKPLCKKNRKKLDQIIYETLHGTGRDL